MSDKTATPTVQIVTETENTEEKAVEKQSFVQKTKHFVKSHKRPAIAVGALAGLVAVAAVTGRKTAPDAPTFVLPDPSVEINETENGFEVIETA